MPENVIDEKKKLNMWILRYSGEASPDLFGGNRQDGLCLRCVKSVRHAVNVVSPSWFAVRRLRSVKVQQRVGRT